MGAAAAPLVSAHLGRKANGSMTNVRAPREEGHHRTRPLAVAAQGIGPRRRLPRLDLWLARPPGFGSPVYGGLIGGGPGNRLGGGLGCGGASAASREGRCGRRRHTRRLGHRRLGQCVAPFRTGRCAVKAVEGVRVDRGEWRRRERAEESHLPLPHALQGLAALSVDERRAYLKGSRSGDSNINININNNGSNSSSSSSSSSNNISIRKK